MKESSRTPDDCTDAGAPSNRGWIRVWDLPTRIFHWSIVVLVLTSWMSADQGKMEIHLYSGSALLALLLFRIIWGFIGSSTARFSDFLTHPRRVWSYLRGDARGGGYAGHNPAGGWMVIVLIAILCAQAITGLFSNDDISFNGPLSTRISKDQSDRLTIVHGAMFNVILLLIWVHVVAVFFYLFVKAENLIRPMCTGKKCRSSVPPDAKLDFVTSIAALVALVTAAFIVFLIVVAVRI
jgi:cytochrome b